MKKKSILFFAGVLCGIFGAQVLKKLPDLLPKLEIDFSDTAETWEDYGEEA